MSTLRSSVNLFKTAIAVSIAALLFPQTLAHAAAPKPGSPCRSVQQVEVIDGFKYSCIKSGKKLVWSKGIKFGSNSGMNNQNSGNSQGSNNQQNSGNNQNGGNNQNSGGGAVTLGSACSTLGQTGPIPNGTAYCVKSANKLIWIYPPTQPIPADGVWIYDANSNGADTKNWNTDLPPSPWSGEPDWFTAAWDIPTSVPIGDKCTGSAILNTYITDLDGIQSITPQGFMQPGSHALPVPHMYYNTGATSDKDPNGVPYRSKIVNMYAPADMTLYGASKLTYTNADGSSYSEYMMTWHFCGTYWMFNAHVGWVAPDIQAAIDNAPLKNCQKGGQLNTSSQDCYSLRFAYKVKAGTLYAKSSGRAHGFDFGFTEASKPIPTRINPKAFAPRWSAGLCHINYYPSEMRAKIEAKLIGNNGCGQLVSDVAGTAQGVWLATDPNKISTSEDYHIALAKHWSDKDLLAISIGWNSDIPGISGGVFTFKPNPAGPSNKPFSEVKDGQTMCYDNLSGSAKNGESIASILIKMVGGSTEKLSIGKGSGPCGAGPYTLPSSVQTFQRIVK